MKKNFLIFAILLLAAFFIAKAQATKSKEPVIILTKNGFSPAGLKVKIGTKVKFVNKTHLSFWPASDLHPNHTIYPKFDPKRALSPRETWEFQFDKLGTFRFHDHLNPINRGTIVVLEEGATDIPNYVSSVGELLDFCQKIEGTDKMKCLNDFLEDAILKKGPDYTFKLVGALRETDPDFASECHTTAHELGGISYWKYAKDKKLPKTGAISYCGFGFVHGFMTEFGHHSKDFLSSSKKVCDHFSDKINYDGFEQMLSPYEMCYHGIGHGLAYYYVPDFGEDVAKVIERGVKDCREFGDELAVDNCEAGLFGGMASVFVGGHGFSLPIDKKDPLALCRLQPNELKRGCYDNMIPVIGVIWPDLAKISSFFTEVEDEFLQQIFDSVGDYASHFVAEGKVTSDEVISECGRLLGNRKIGCFYGFSQGIIRNYFPAEAPRLALGVCRSEKLTEIEKESCIKGVMTEIKNVLPNLFEGSLMELTDKEKRLVI